MASVTAHEDDLGSGEGSNVANRVLGDWLERRPKALGYLRRESREDKNFRRQNSQQR